MNRIGSGSNVLFARDLFWKVSRQIGIMRSRKRTPGHLVSGRGQALDDTI